MTHLAVINASFRDAEIPTEVKSFPRGANLGKRFLPMAQWKSSNKLSQNWKDKKGDRFLLGKTLLEV